MTKRQCGASTIGMVVLFSFGCGRTALDEPPAVSSSSPTLENSTAGSAPSETLNWGGQTWKLVGPFRNDAGLVPTMEGNVFLSDDGDSRLLMLERPVNEEHSWKQIVFMQKRTAKSDWRKDGTFEEWFTDGEHRLAHHRMGQLHGEFKAWYPNGQLHIRETYVDGKLEGLSQGWYPNGQKQYEATYRQDEEVSGKNWDEDGTPLK